MSCCAQIHVEDFRVVTESYGMQLDDDSILALFSRVRGCPSTCMIWLFCHVHTGILLGPKQNIVSFVTSDVSAV